VIFILLDVELWMGSLNFFFCYILYIYILIFFGQFSVFPAQSRVPDTSWLSLFVWDVDMIRHGWIFELITTKSKLDVFIQNTRGEVRTT